MGDNPRCVHLISGTEELSRCQRFIEAARKAEASEDEAVFDETLKRIAKAKPEKTKRSDD